MIDGLDEALAEGRAAAEARMTETVTVGEYRDSTDPTTGQAVRVPVVQRYPASDDVSPGAGRARLKYPSLAVSESSQSSQVVSAQEPLLSIPTGSPELHEGDEVRVLASTSDSMLVGRVFRVQGAPQSGQTTSARYPLKELS